MRASGRGGGRTLYDARVNHVVLVPVKAFADAKARLATVLSPGEREALARWTAERVLAAAGELPVYIACDSEAVAEWATAHGATVLWHPGVGLNAAVNRSVADLRRAPCRRSLRRDPRCRRLRRQGVDHVVVAHGDLPRAAALAAVVIPGALTLVPDARGDGTNVIALPLHLLFEFEYGPGSFRRHLQRAVASGLPVAVRRDPMLAIDIDTPSDLTRRREQRAAARLLAGERAGEVVFLGEVDGELANSLALRGEVARVIRMLRPQVILAHDPWKHYRLHPDHREAGLLACDGIVAARDPHFNKEHGLAPHRPDALLLWEAEAPDHVEDVDGFVEHKLRALEAHESQFESTMKAVDAIQMTAFRERISTRMTDLGALHEVPAAEVFKRISDL